MDRLILATSNQDKVQEISSLLLDLNITVLSINDFSDYPVVVEDQDTLKGNAIKKAREFASYFNMPALADDTGLEVDFLNGEPGIFSARYAGEYTSYETNVQKLLKELDAVPTKERKAQFRTVMSFAIDDQVYSVEGVCKGLITSDKRGTGGFGYDPVFYVPKLDKTFAEMSLSEKNQISHRGIALRKAKELLLSKFGA